MNMVATALRAGTSVDKRLARIANGGKPRVLDMFAGAGGISLGFHRTGFEISGALEIDPWAARTHALNFHGLSADALALHSHARDMTTVEPADICAELGLGDIDDAIDVLIGGPPCQAYARIGRAKLRQVAQHADAFENDPRRNLYLRYLEYVKALKPLAILMENVPDILNQRGRNIIEEMIETLDGLGYDARYSLINTSFHGVPQMRDRVFLIAYRKEMGVSIRFPTATHHMQLPSGYAGTRAVALKHVDQKGGGKYIPADLGDSSLPFPVTAEQAIGDLPFVRGDSVTRGARRFDQLLPYRSDVDVTPYQRLMRNWPGFEAGDGLLDHVIRHHPRDFQVFTEMRQGAEYPEAHATAVTIFEREATRLGLAAGTEPYTTLFDAIVPPYDITKFPNRWWKIRSDFPTRTLTAHIGKDTYSHIHYDGEQMRTISVREAARLQSFPDGFRFTGTMNPAFRQIGNAVPPVMAAAIGSVMKEALVEAALRNPLRELDLVNLSH